jgi:hypothetical protein
MSGIYDYLWITSSITAFVTFLWMALMIKGAGRQEPVHTVDDAVAHASRGGWEYYLGYINAALITVSATILLSGLYYLFAGRVWTWVAGAFIPVYCTLNLVSYLSQVTVIPRLLAMKEAGKDSNTVDLLIGQMVHVWPGSAVHVLNALAYAVFGIPSIVFGWYMMDAGAPAAITAAGVLLVLNAVVCIVGFAGVIMRNAMLGLGSVAGGVLFAFALIAMIVGFVQLSNMY